MQYPSSEIRLWPERIKSLKILVIGDLMLDKYISGQVQRISPEAPVPILNTEKEESRLGGAANVALNCKSLGAQVYIAGFIGDDMDGHRISELLFEHNIHAELVLKDTSRCTTCKTRISSKNQQLLRIDNESTHFLSIELEHLFIDKLLRFIQIEKPDIVIFEDYDKGCLNANVIEKTLNHCKHLGCVIAVDPKKKHFFEYKDVDIFKPNLSEVRTALPSLQIHDTLLHEIDFYQAELKQRISPKNLLVTLSENGVYIHSGETSTIFPAKKRKITDVSGAGDTVV